MAVQVVTSLPLKSLVTPLGVAQRLQGLYESDIRALLRSGRVRFIVADVGLPLEIMSESECFDFWKKEVQSHLADPTGAASLDDFPDNYFYRASLWHDSGSPIVLLSKSH